MTQIKKDGDSVLLSDDFSYDNGYLARKAINAYVKNDIPIPDELKPHLYVMTSAYSATKYGTYKTKDLWKNRYRAVCFHVIEHAIDHDKKHAIKMAIEAVADETCCNDATLEKRFYAIQKKEKENTGTTLIEKIEESLRTI